MKFKIIALLLVLLPLCISCGSNKKENQNESDVKFKTLVLYYSQTGATKNVAELLKADLGADIDSIIPVESYGNDYEATIQRWQKEKEDSVKVAIKQLYKYKQLRHNLSWIPYLGWNFCFSGCNMA